MLRCETNRHALRSEGIRSLLSGRVGGDHVVAVTSRRSFSRTPQQLGVSGPRIGGDGNIASATSRRRRRATVSDGGVSNR